MTFYVKLGSLLKQPLTRSDLYGRADIRAPIKSVDDVSNRLAYSRREEADLPKKPVTVEDVKPQRLARLKYRREPDGAVTIIDDKLEITVRRKQHSFLGKSLSKTS